MLEEEEELEGKVKSILNVGVHVSTSACGKVDQWLHFKSKADMKVKEVDEVMWTEKIKGPRMSHWGTLMSTRQ